MKKWEDAAADALVASLTTDFLEAELSVADRALLTYADKLTRTPGEMSTADVEPLRAAGLDDRGIHDLCAIVAYFAFVNRIADGLGVELESDSR